MGTLDSTIHATMASDSGPEYDNSLARVINILVAIMNILVCCLIGAYAVIERIIPADDAQTVAVGVFVTLFALGYISSELVRPRLFYVYFGAVRDYFGAGALQIFLAVAVADVEEDFGLVTAIVGLVWGFICGIVQFLPIPRHSPIFKTAASDDFVHGRLSLVGVTATPEFFRAAKKADKASSKKNASKKGSKASKASKKDAKASKKDKKASKKDSKASKKDKKASKKAKPAPSSPSLSDADSYDYESTY